MTEFKVGDTVRFIEEYNGIPAGTEATALLVHSDALNVKLLDGVVDLWGRYKDIYALKKRFEKVQERKLAVGDYVRLKEPNSGLETGTVARVTKLHEDTGVGYGPAVSVDLLNGVKTPNGNRDKDLYFFESQLQKILYANKADEAGYKPGDRVKVLDVSTAGGVHKHKLGSVLNNYSPDYINVKLDDVDHDYYPFRADEIKAHTPSELEKSKFSVDDKVTVVKTYIGLQGKVGTVKADNPAYDNFYINVRFEDVDWLLKADELDFAPEPSSKAQQRMAEAGVAVGDRVTVVRGGTTKGKVGTVVQPEDTDLYILVKLDGSEYVWHHMPNEIELVKPGPERVFQPGDWVEVHGRDDHWNGTIGQVQADGAWFADGYKAFFVDVKTSEGEELTFLESKLRKTDAPVPFKEGDWVRVKGYAGSNAYDNVVGQFVGLDGEDGDWGSITQHPHGNGRRFPLENLVATDAPEPEKTWVEKLPIGTVGVTKYSSDGPISRILHKDAADQWTVQYGVRRTLPNGEPAGDLTSQRTNADVKTIVGFEENLILI